MGSTFIILGLLIFTAHLFSAIFSKRRIPDVLLLMLIGIVVGPVLHLISAEQLNSIGPTFSSLTLLLILFDSGVDLSIYAIRRYWRGVVHVTLLSFCLSMAAVTFFGHYVLHFGWQASALAGSIVAGTAAAIVIPLVRQMKASEKTRTVLTLESAISGVLCIVVTLAIIDGAKIGQISAAGIVGLVGIVMSSFVMALLLGVVGGVLWAGLLDRVRKLQNSMFLTPAFVFVLYGIAEALGYSGAIAALSFGIVLGNAKYFDFPFLHKVKIHELQPLQRSEKGFFKEIVFILKTYFFVYVGICIPFTDMQALLYGLMIAAMLFVVRFALIYIVGRKNTRNDRLVVAMMIPKGLVAAVLASIPARVNEEMGYVLIPGAEMLQSVVYSVIFCSIIITSLLVFVTHKRLLKSGKQVAESLNQEKALQEKEQLEEK